MGTSVFSLSKLGLEKLNEITTLFYQHASNHKEQESLLQVLEKQNRKEELEANGYQRELREQRCTKCKEIGHNKRTCYNLNL